MRKKTKLILLVVVLAGLIWSGYYFIFFRQSHQNNPVQILVDNLFGWKFPVAEFPLTGPGEQLAYSDIRDPGGRPQGLPIRLKIPAISVDSAIEDALITKEGRMDVPEGSVNVAWFALGPHPGEKGSAVVGGHFGIKDGVPFVFYNLDKLKVGDKVYVVDDNGNTLAFIVRSFQSFDRNADATTVFTSTDGLAHLNLITCEGIWNQINGTYPERLVVFTDAIPAEGQVVPAAITAGAFPRSLRIGMRGADVSTLQTALEQKGLLTMPRGVAKGYFGVLTRTAVAKYQTSVALKSTGIFEASTRAKLIPEALAVGAKFPATAIAVLSSTTAAIFPPLIQSAQSFFATPVAKIIFALLLAAIIFMMVKIIRR
ncbi:MAG: sortase [bacterium]|nr:sortase [bacterium]